MDYRLKVIIAGVEMPEASETVDDQTDGVEYKAPSVSNVILQDNASSGVMLIGATPSDQLTFTINNPNRKNYDGEKVEFWIAPPSEDTAVMEEAASIEDEVGSDTAEEAIDGSETSDEYDDGETAGEDPTEEELADVAEQNAAQVESRYTLFEGVDQAVEEETTDESEEPEWRRVGTYYVDSQRNSDSDNTSILTCYDSMQKLNGAFVPENDINTLQGFFDDLRAQALSECGVTIDPFVYDEELFNPEAEAKWPVRLCSYREALGYFAGLIGAFATCGDDGTIGFSLYSFIDGLYLDSALNYIKKDSSGELELDGIRCNIGVSKTQYINAGFDADLSFDDPLMTEDALEAILETYKGIRFSGAEFNMTWDDSIVAGSFIRMMSPEEYANYIGISNSLEDTSQLTEAEILALKEQMNALGDIYLVSAQTIDFSGDASTTITSVCTSGTQNANQMIGPYNQRMLRLGENIDSLETRVDEAESAMDSIEADIGVLGDRVSTAEDNITVVEDDITTIQSRVVSAEEDIEDTLTGLALAQDIVGTLAWITSHSTVTADTSPVSGKSYYIKQDGTFTLVIDTEGKNPAQEGWYELDSSMQNYIASHLALTDEGLWVQTDENAARLLISSDGITIYNSSGPVAEYSDFVMLGDKNGFHITLGSALGHGGLGFWQGNTEVAYINEKKLYINEAEVTSDLRIGMLEWIVRSNRRVTLKYSPK